MGVVVALALISAAWITVLPPVQDLLGHPGLTAGWVQSRTGCLRRSADPPDRGAGDDWECQVAWPASDGTRCKRRTT